MPHNLSMSMFDLELPKYDLLSKKLKYSIHCITYVLEKRTTVVVSMHIVRRSRTYESCLACQHFIPNLIAFVDLLTIFCFSMQMPIDTCSNIFLKNPKNYSHFTLRQDKPSSSSFVSHFSQLPHSRHVLHFSPSTKFPRNARGNIIRRKIGTFQI